MIDPLAKYVILADGTELKNTYCSMTDNGTSLWCWVNGKSFSECFKLFEDPYKTSEITSYYYGKKYIYHGFTEILLIQKSYNDNIDVRLTWPEGGEHSVEELEEPEDE